MVSEEKEPSSQLSQYWKYVLCNIPFMETEKAVKVQRKVMKKLKLALKASPRSSWGLPTCAVILRALYILKIRKRRPRARKESDSANGLKKSLVTWKRHTSDNHYHNSYTNLGSKNTIFESLILSLHISLVADYIIVISLCVISY